MYSKVSVYRWLVLIASSYTFIAFAFSMQIIPPVISDVIEEFHISNAEGGLLMSLVVIPGVFLAIPSGILIKKVGFRKLGSFSATLVTIGSAFTALSSSFSTVLIGRLLIGIGGAFIVTITPSIIPQWFHQKELGRAMGVYGINMPIATTAAFILANLAFNQGWRYPVYFTVAVGAVSIAATIFLMKEGPLKNAYSMSPPRIGEALKNFEIWKTGLVWLFFNATVISFVTWSTRLFEVFRGTPPAFGGVMIVMMMLVSIPFVPCFGLLSDKIGGKKPIMIAGFSFIVLVMLIMPMLPASMVILAVILLGIVVSTVPPIIMTLPSQILTPSSAGVGFGVVTVCLNAGIALAPPLIGLIVDATSSLTMAFAGMAVFSVIGTFLVYSLKMK